MPHLHLSFVKMQYLNSLPRTGSGMSDVISRTRQMKNHVGGKVTIPYNACNYTLPDSRSLPVNTTDRIDKPLPRSWTGLPPPKSTGGTAMSWRPTTVLRLSFIDLAAK